MAGVPTVTPARPPATAPAPTDRHDPQSPEGEQVEFGFRHQAAGADPVPSVQFYDLTLQRSERDAALRITGVDGAEDYAESTMVFGYVEETCGHEQTLALGGKLHGIGIWDDEEGLVEDPDAGATR